MVSAGPGMAGVWEGGSVLLEDCTDDAAATCDAGRGTVGAAATMGTHTSQPCSENCSWKPFMHLVAARWVHLGHRKRVAPKTTAALAWDEMQRRCTTLHAVVVPLQMMSSSV